jgi:hypothetical protein
MNVLFHTIPEKGTFDPVIGFGEPGVLVNLLRKDGLCWTTERGGGVNQLLPCLNNYAYFKLFAEHLMTITIMQGGKQ